MHCYAPIPTPAGPAFLAWSETGVTALDLGSDEAGFLARYRARVGGPAATVHRRPGPDPDLADAVADALAGGPPSALRFDLSALSPFTREVLSAAREIPWGEVRTYGWVADRVGRPGAARAVGSALGRNPICMLIPCHRVVRGGGALGGYALGLDVKRALLERERDLVTSGNTRIQLYG